MFPMFKLAQKYTFILNSIHLLGYFDDSKIFGWHDFSLLIKERLTLQSVCKNGFLMMKRYE